MGDEEPSWRTTRTGVTAMAGRTDEEEATLPLAAYFGDGYFSHEQWASMLAQVKAVRRLEGVSSVLEVGPGNGFVAAILRRCALRVTTVDVNPMLEPDFTASVVELSRHLPARGFDAVLCAEVLEHLPFSQLPEALYNIAAVARRWAVITLPLSGRTLHVGVRVPRGRHFDWRLRILRSWVLPEHHREIGSSSGTRLSQVLDIMRRYFSVEKHYDIPGHPRNRVFVLRALKPGAITFRKP